MSILSELQESKFQTRKLFWKISENMHYEILKYLNSTELIVIRGASLGGYQIVSNPILRARIKNYYSRNKAIRFRELVKVKECEKKMQIMLLQTGKLELNLEKMQISDQDCTELAKILEYIPQLKGINLSKKFNNM